MSTTVTLDCATLAPAPVQNRLFHLCWGMRALPSTLNFSAGPTTLVAPNTTMCPNWPTTLISGTMSRGLYGSSICNAVWSYINPTTLWGIDFNWTYPSGDQPISCSVNMAEMWPFWVVGSNQSGVTYINPTGSCSQDPVTGIVTMNFTVTLTNGLCTCPVTITFNG